MLIKYFTRCPLLCTVNRTQQASRHYTVIMARYHAMIVSSNNYHTDPRSN